MNIITALKNPEINKTLKEKTNFNIVGNDIQYQEGIIEMLEKNGDIDIIIISEILPGDIDFKELIYNIKNIQNQIEIIIIMEKKNEELENFFISKGIFNIFYNNETTIEELTEIIIKKEKNKKEIELDEEIKILKNLILENSKKIKKEKNIYKIFKCKKERIIKKFKLNRKNENQLTKKVISITGANGVGKSIFASILTKLIKDKKILLVDFDVFNQSINSSFNVKRYCKKESNPKGNIEDLIVNINKNINLLCVTDILFNEEYKIEKSKIKNIIKRLSKKYDYIIIDTTSECFFDYTKEILENSNLIIFLTETNLLGLKKSKRLLDIYINKWKIKKDKINIIFNKENVNSISRKILKTLFSDFKISGKLKLNNKYNLIINNNLNNIDKKIKKEFITIIKNCNLYK